MFIARITQARFQFKFLYLQSGAMRSVARPNVKVLAGPMAPNPAGVSLVCEEANPVYGRVYCPELFASNIAATTGALAQLPLQLGDEVRYDVVGGDIVLQQVVRVCGAAAAVVGGAVLTVQPIQKETTPSCN
jgi:hypothetical protein